MSLTLDSVVDGLESWFPPALAEDWDPVGWQIEPSRTTVESILLAVEVEPDLVADLGPEPPDLVITHHPLLFDGLDRLLQEDPTARTVREFVTRDVGLFAAHTNADAAAGGLNDVLADRLGVRETVPLEPGEEPDVGLGRVGKLETERTIAEVEERLLSELPLRHLQVTAEPDRPVRTVALCTGSGGDFVSPKLADRADLYITGDVGHHTALRARELDLPLIVPDHHDMETLFCDLVHRKLTRAFSDELSVSTWNRPYPYRHRGPVAEDDPTL